MGRIIAIDYGKKRVGIAATDPLKLIANKIGTVRTHDIWDFLHDYLKKEDIERIIIGYPRQMNNQASEAVQYINPFIKKLTRSYPGIPVELIDERFTSKMALRAMIDGGLKKKDRQDKALVDSVSATIILQTYLEQQRYQK